jgi:hypothetical protein
LIAGLDGEGSSRSPNAEIGEEGGIVVLKAVQFYLGRAEERSGEDQGNEEERFQKEAGKEPTSRRQRARCFMGSVSGRESVGPCVTRLRCSDKSVAKS